MKNRMPGARASDETLRAFWAKHSLTEFEGQLRRVQVKFPKPQKRLVSLRVEQSTLDALRALAQRKGVGYLTLARMWITERLGREIQHLHPRSAVHR